MKLFPGFSQLWKCIMTKYINYNYNFYLNFPTQLFTVGTVHTVHFVMQAFQEYCTGIHSFHSLRCWEELIKNTNTYTGSTLSALAIKGTVSWDFLLLVFFINQFPLSPRVSHLDSFKFFRKVAEIFASQGWPPVSTTPVANEKNLPSEKL